MEWLSQGQLPAPPAPQVLSLSPEKVVGWGVAVLYTPWAEPTETQPSPRLRGPREGWLNPERGSPELRDPQL